MLTGNLDTNYRAFIILEISEHCYICVNFHTYKIVINA